MLFSAHVVDTGPVRAITRRAPKPDDVAGLRTALTTVCGPFHPGLVPRPQLGREALLACWDEADALHRFLRDDPTGQAFAEGWGVEMELFRAVGVFPGLDDDMGEIARNASPGTGPTVALTIGTFYVRRFPRFLQVNRALEAQFLADEDAIWGTGLADLPKRTVGTLTVWPSARAATSYMRSGAHAEAVRDHFDPAKDPTGHTFVTGGGFFGFRPVASSGSLDGKNPIAESMLVPA